MKIGFFGGAFNPPTIAHINLVKEALKEYSFDAIYFVPVNNFYKKQGLIDISQRIDMLNLECKNNSKMFVSEIEKEMNREFKANEIFEIIKEKYSDDDLYFLMGEDNYEKMSSWENYEKLKEYKYLIFQRRESKALEIKSPNIIYMENKENLKISSSIIRNMIRKNQDIEKYVSKNVKEYIIENNLYRKRNEREYYKVY